MQNFSIIAICNARNNLPLNTLMLEQTMYTFHTVQYFMLNDFMFKCLPQSTYCKNSKIHKKSATHLYFYLTKGSQYMATKLIVSHLEPFLQWLNFFFLARQGCPRKSFGRGNVKHLVKALFPDLTVRLKWHIAETRLLLHIIHLLFHKLRSLESE